MVDGRVLGGFMLIGMALIWVDRVYFPSYLNHSNILYTFLFIGTSILEGMYVFNIVVILGFKVIVARIISISIFGSLFLIWLWQYISTNQFFDL